MIISTLPCLIQCLHNRLRQYSHPKQNRSIRQQHKVQSSHSPIAKIPSSLRLLVKITSYPNHRSLRIMSYWSGRGKTHSSAVSKAPPITATCQPLGTSCKQVQSN